VVFERRKPGDFKRAKRDSPKSTAAKRALRLRVPTEIPETQFPEETHRETSLGTTAWNEGSEWRLRLSGLQNTGETRNPKNALSINEARRVRTILESPRLSTPGGAGA
jgi:hypothetical protein